MMRSESTSALGQPSETKLIRRAGSGGGDGFDVLGGHGGRYRLFAAADASVPS